MKPSLAKSLTTSNLKYLDVFVTHEPDHITLTKCNQNPHLAFFCATHKHKMLTNVLIQNNKGCTFHGMYCLMRIGPYSPNSFSPSPSTQLEELIEFALDKSEAQKAQKVLDGLCGILNFDVAQRLKLRIPKCPPLGSKVPTVLIVCAVCISVQ